MKKIDLLTIGVLSLLFAYTWYLFPSLPESVPIHFDSQGQADRFGGRGSIFMLPGMMIFVIAVTLVGLGFSPEGSRASQSRGSISHIILAITIMIGGIHLDQLQGIQAGTNSIGVFSVMGFGVFLLISGNVFGKVEKNYMVGIRLPWTLESKENWLATHRFAGKCMVVGGMILVVSAFWLPHFFIGVAVLLSALLIPCFYSFWYYNKFERNKVSE